MKVLKKAWININDLDKMQENNFREHYKNNENVYILTTIENMKYNIEYKIINIENNIINLEFTGNIIK